MAFLTPMVPPYLGGLLTAVKTVAGDYTITADDGVILVDAAAKTITLPDGSGLTPGQVFVIANTANGSATLVTAVAGIVDGQNPYAGLTLPNSWHVFAWVAGSWSTVDEQLPGVTSDGVGGLNIPGGLTFTDADNGIAATNHAGGTHTILSWADGGSASIADGAHVLAPDGSGSLANNLLVWDALGNLEVVSLAINNGLTLLNFRILTDSYVIPPGPGISPFASYPTELILIMNASGKTITLPDPYTCWGQVFFLKNGGSGDTTTVATAAGTIDGAATITLAAAWDRVLVFSNGTDWYRLA